MTTDYLLRSLVMKGPRGLQVTYIDVLVHGVFVSERYSVEAIAHLLICIY